MRKTNVDMCRMMAVPSTRRCSLRFLIVFAAILLPVVLAAQVTFEQTYDGPPYDHIGALRQTTDDGHILATGGRESARKSVVAH